MPLDPSIILSGTSNAGTGVDVNALMQQQMQGMANINAMERQRKADALVMQDRAAAAAKEQEAAAIKALLPAYTYGIQTGDIAGAGNLVPPEMRDQLQPFIDALSGKSPQEVQSALIGSLSSSPEGQEALAAIQRAQTYGVQAQQAKTAQDRLAFDIDQAGKPAAMTPYQEAQIALERDKFNADKAAKEAVASGEAPPVTLQKGEKWNPEKQRVEAAPGSELYRKQKSEYVKDYKEAETTLQRLDNVAQTAADLKGTTGWQKAFGTGAIMSRMPNTPLSSVTGAYDFQTKYDNLTGAVKEFGRAVASMQGKLGNMAVQEWKNVADSVAALDLTKMSGDELDAQLDRISDQIAVAQSNVRRAYEMEYGGSQYYEPLAGGAPAASGKELPKVASDTEYDALPSGAEFIDPEGTRRRKP